MISLFVIRTASHHGWAPVQPKELEALVHVAGVEPSPDGTAPPASMRSRIESWTTAMKDAKKDVLPHLLTVIDSGGGSP